MEQQGLLAQAFVYLLAAVLVVPITRRLGFGAVLGYLTAGIAIGPWGLGLIRHAQDILHFAEFGVVLLLFVIGLELEPRRLWAMRKPIFGLGAAQVFFTTAVLCGIGIALGLTLPVALVAAMGLSLSSTAMALQLLTEKNLLPTPAGHSGFSVLLFQDIVVIPMLAIIPFLVADSASTKVSGFDWTALLKALGVIALIIIGGRYVLRHILRLIAATGLRELFTAFALLLVIAAALAMQAVGLSMALGAFLAGVLLAESEYRHALETDIEPFKGLLLGLFFIAVGMSIDFGVLLRDPLTVLALAFGLVTVKAAILLILGRVFGLPAPQLPLFALVLSQGGEFAFVIFSVALGSDVLPSNVLDLLVVTVALSMATTPILMRIHDTLMGRLTQRGPSLPMDELHDQGHPVIIAGFGRFGQIIGRLLHANGIDATVLEHDPNHIETLRRFHFKVFYGDALRLDLLQAAGAANARMLVVAIDDRKGATQLVELAREHFPRLQVIARAWDVPHAVELMNKGVHVLERETFEGALRLGEAALKILGFTAWRAKQAAHRFRAHNLETLVQLRNNFHEDVKVRARISADAREQLRALMRNDEQHVDALSDEDWRRTSKGSVDGSEFDLDQQK